MVRPFGPSFSRTLATRQVALLPWHHRDPFDRMLLAQAQVEKLVLLTADEALGGHTAQRFTWRAEVAPYTHISKYGSMGV